MASVLQMGLGAQYIFGFLFSVAHWRAWRYNRSLACVWQKEWMLITYEELATGLEDAWLMAGLHEHLLAESVVP